MNEEQIMRFENKILKALGLEDKHVCGIQIDLQCGKSPLVTIERYLEQEEAGSLCKVMVEESYNLVGIKND